MLPQPLRRFIELFAKLPGIGPRQASRIAFWLIRRGSGEIRILRESLEDLERNVKTCRQCFFVYAEMRSQSAAQEGLCDICRDSRRDSSLLAVVEKETDLMTIEKTKKYHGMYHVLGGTLSPFARKNEMPLTIKELEDRVNKKTFQEIILALSPTTAGDFTADELTRLLKPHAMRITRLGRGLSRGAEVEFADEETITNALEGRK